MSSQKCWNCGIKNSRYLGRDRTQTVSHLQLHSISSTVKHSQNGIEVASALASQQFDTTAKGATLELQSFKINYYLKLQFK